MRIRDPTGLERGVSEMTILNYLRNLLNRGDSMNRSDFDPELEYVHVSQERTSAVEIGAVPPTEARDVENEVDLANLTDLEAYARGSSVSKKSIEQWISSGLLMPEELKVAEKLIKIMCKT
jgi:hypothetical protein